MTAQANLFSRGAVKSNIGHLEGGSGLAGIIKAIMILEKGIIPPNANFIRMNPKIDAEFLNIKVGTANLYLVSPLIVTVSNQLCPLAFRRITPGLCCFFRRRGF